MSTTVLLLLWVTLPIAGVGMLAALVSLLAHMLRKA